MLTLGYSTLYTALPVVSILMDKDTNVDNIIKFPLLYMKLLKGRELNYKAFLFWFLNSIFPVFFIGI